MIKKIFTENKFEFLIFVIISALMMSNFSNIYLWIDEGETVTLAKNIESGIPRYYDGKNLVLVMIQDANPDFIWTQSSWLHIYVTALSFSLLGFSTFNARLIFVIIGILAFFPIVVLFKKISINKLHYYLSILAVLFFVPYYLYSRQARYYALLIFLMPIIAISIYNLAFKNGSIVWFAISFTLLFYSNHFSFFILMLTTSIYFIYIISKKTSKRKSLFKKLIISYIIIFFLTLPWAVYADISRLIKTNTGLAFQVIEKIYYILHSINSTIPILLIVSSTFFMLFFYFKKSETIKKEKIFFSFFIGITPIIILLLPQYNDIRYLIGLFPLWISFILLPIIFLIGKKEYISKIIGVAILLLFLFTNIFYSISFYFFLPFENILQEKCSSFIPEKSDYCDSWIKDTFISPRELKYPFFYYLYEITHDYDGPIEGVVTYLKLEGDENSVVFTNNWASVIAFYTNMKVLKDPEYMNTDLTPDFIVANFPTRRDIQETNYLVTYAETRNYTKVTLPYPDLPWENRPTMWYHKFWTQPVEVPVTIYVK